jgi:hypothetical protein
MRGKIKEDTKATARCIPLEQPGGRGKCIFCAEDAEKVFCTSILAQLLMALTKKSESIE